MRIQKDDRVIIITGKDRNKVGVVERVLPTKNQVVVTGLNMIKKHIKKSAKNPSGGVLDITKPIHASNVMLLDPQKQKPTRIQYKLINEKKIRLAKLSQSPLVKRDDKS